LFSSAKCILVGCRNNLFRSASASSLYPHHPRDNVALIANPEGLPAGTRFPTGLTLTENILQSHKVALFDLDAGDPIIRYGHEIGSATRTIRAGSWVREDSITLPMPPALDSLPMATDVPAPQAKLEGHTFEGFRNPDGSAGTKNLLESPPRFNALLRLLILQWIESSTKSCLVTQTLMELLRLRIRTDAELH